MKNNQITSGVTSDDTTYKVHGTVRDTYQQLMPNVTVSVYNKTMRGKTLLGTVITAADGSYAIAYTIKNIKTAALIVGVYDSKGNTLKENDVLYNIPEDLQTDFDLSGRPLPNQTDYERLMELIAPFVEDLPLVKMTETAAHPDLSFIAQKTGLSLNAIEQLAIAAHFETFSAIPAYVWYGILVATSTSRPAAANFEDKVSQLYDVLMHSTVDNLITSLQSAINANTIAYHYMADVPEISKKLNVQIIAYAKQHPVTGEPSALLQKLHISGLKGADLEAFITAKINHAGTEDEFWDKLQQAQILNHPAKAGAVRATMQVANITGNNLPLTQTLVNDHKITNVADIKQLAGYNHQEWVDILKKNDIEPDSTTPGKTHAEKIKNYAAYLDATFTDAYPTAAFSSRLLKDKGSKLPMRDKVSKFLQKNEDFDLLNHHVGSFIKNKPNAVAKKDVAEVTDHIRRIQRVMKLTPSYESSSVLLNDNIHSAQQIYKMGQDNFVKTYGDKLGESKATQVFQQAAATHATALAFTSNLKSMADASSIKAFPDFSAAITTQLSADLPNLDTLFQHVDFCECDECASVYGASAYLTDILHYLAQRHSTLPAVGGTRPSVKDILLQRRPDLGDIDLNCDNTNTLVPYIDIACELMEDFISPPVITLANSLFASLDPGPIAATLLTAIKTQFTTAGQTNVATLLTAAAKVSDSYTLTHLLDDDTFGTEEHYIIRDAQIALKATVGTGAAPTVEIRILHQTFEDTDTINAGPEYVNTNVYSNLLANAKRPFSLPFNLFETEGELYLQQLGIQKSDLIDIFRKEDHTAPGASASDIRLGYTSLGISFAEQTIISTPDPTHLSLYWGGDGTDAFSWTKDALLAADTAKIKQVVKSKYVNADWVQISKTIQDKLREKKRDALIAYLLSTDNWHNVDEIYAYFLIDVEMCSCQPTSRIVQATNTIQLFVQRCFMQLEQNVLIDTTADSVWGQWEWMKNFRVWQANKKVFLWPENYIEPELLPADIKSSFFSDLENDLLQGEVNADTVTTAFENYAQKLSEVAKLEVKNHYYDDFSKTLHVFARTYGGDPKTYYYRKFIEGRTWTPWEMVNLDIAGEYIIPVVYNNNLYLYWPVFKLTPNGVDPKALGTWQLQLAFSQYKNGKWLQKKVSEFNADGTLTFSQSDFPDSSRFFFVPFDIPEVTWLDAAGKPIGGQAQIDLQKKSVLKNGTMVINCHYFDSTDTPVNALNNKFVGGFQLNAIGGYPSHPAYNISGFNMQLWKTSVLTKDQSGAFNLINMLDTEVTTPAAPVLPGNTTPLPSQLRTNYQIAAALQPSYVARINFTNFLKPDWLAIAPDGPGGHYMRYFLQDKNRVYYVRPEITDNANVEYAYENFLDDNLSQLSTGSPNLSNTKNRDRFFNFYHPKISFLMQQLFLKGVDGLMDRNTQLISETTFSTYFKDLYHVKNDIVYTGDGGPKEDVDFSSTSAFSLYNWELFYHAPLMIAERLSQNQQFDDADHWYKYIFNPLDTSSNPAPNKFWNTKPFFETTSAEYLAQRIDVILGTGSKAQSSPINDLTNWRYEPFQPHLIAQYRTVAYQKVAVMKYIGHLIRYGDYLFAQDTMESVNQATQLYILASEILGPKPQTIRSPVVQPVDNYNQLEGKLDTLSDALVSVENLLPFQSVTGFTPGQQGLPTLLTQYFCLPMNENLTGPTGYWDVITDRLFKIRHCLNIDGTLAPLALFAPVINPALLVRATAAGLDLGSVLNDLNSPLPIYRFSVIAQKATEICSEVKSLGSLMLSVLEKKDAEALSILRNGQETKLLKAVSLLKKKQIDDAQAAIELLIKQKESAMLRKTYYSGLISTGLNSKEKKALDFNKISFELDEAAAILYLGSSIANHEPTLILGAIVGTPGGAVNTAKFGGETVGSALANMGRNAGSIATALDKKAGLTSVNAGYERRLQEWQLQLDLSNKDLEQFDKQIANAQLRLEIAQQDADNQQLQIDQSQETADFFTSKYTNQDLYNFMITQVSNTYFKSYQLAYKVAKQAEQCFRYELGLEDSAYINFGYWDSLRKGLTSGEQLFYDIKAMEVAYLDQNKRELELTKSVSLSQLDPVALYKLKTTGECWLNLPEELFDMDYPGHYMRRIKSVSLTIPCIAGPYTTVSAKLTMTNNSMRTSSLAATDAAQYSRKMTTGSAPVPTDDPRFRDSVGALQSISTSSAQNDSGLFELNFRDERYLPFEGAGVISLWHLELPSFATIKQFDFDTISDVIIHLKYTARDGGDLLKANAATSLKTRINQMLVSTKDTGLMRVLSAKNDLPTEWYRFLNPVNATDDQVFTVNLDKSRFPLFVQDKAIKIKSIELIAYSTVSAINGLVVTPAPSAPTAVNLTKTNIYGANNLSVAMTYNNDPGTWVIKNPVAKARLTADMLNNLVMIIHYTVS